MVDVDTHFSSLEQRVAFDETVRLMRANLKIRTNLRCSSLTIHRPFLLSLLVKIDFPPSPSSVIGTFLTEEQEAIRISSATMKTSP